MIIDIEKSAGIQIPLNNQNVFCFDNESFRFLAALKNSFPFKQVEKEDFKKSWEVSVENSNRLLQYVCKLTMHDIQETVRLNEARQILTELAKPIAEISQNIQINLKLTQDKKNELEKGKFTLRDLNQSLYITQIDLMPKPLGYPRTVCTSSECTRVVSIGQMTKVDYVTHCHPHCFLDGVQQESINNVNLQKCACMDPNFKCMVCRHDWSLHMHISYENEQSEVQVIDQNIQDMINQKASHQTIVKAAIDSAQDLINQYEKEQKQIIDISAKFAHFTRKNAIVVFNDDLDAYLDLLIREEEGKKQAGADNESVLQGLKDVKNGYREKKRIFDQALNTFGNQHIDLSSSDINQLVNDLYQLPMSGDKIKAVVDNLRKINQKFK
jgi:hypothetical protein